MYRMGGEPSEHIHTPRQNQPTPLPIANLEGPERIQSCLCTRLVQTAYPFGENYVCEDCHNELFDHVPIGQALQRDLPNHFLSGGPARNRVSYCYECRTVISESRPATHCIQCVISYNRLNRLERVLVANGAQIKITATHSPRYPSL